MGQYGFASLILRFSPPCRIASGFASIIGDSFIRRQAIMAPQELKQNTWCESCHGWCALLLDLGWERWNGQGNFEMGEKKLGCS